MSWIAAIDYWQGSSHRRAGIPCQDYGRLIQLDEITVIAAMADGAGSARLSHIGSRTAVDTALFWMRRKIAANPGGRGTVSSLPLRQLYDGFIDATRTVIKHAAQANDASVDDLACTLTVIALAPNSVIAAQIGDGIVVARLADAKYRLLIQPDRGEYANETSFVTDLDADEHLQIEALNGPVRFVSAATDGLTHISVDYQSNAPYTPFFQPIDKFTRQSPDASAVHDGLREFLRSDRLAQKTEDDIALMVCGWRSIAA